MNSSIDIYQMNQNELFYLDAVPIPIRVDKINVSLWLFMDKKLWECEGILVSVFLLSSEYEVL